MSYKDSEHQEMGCIVVPPEVDNIGQLSYVGTESTLNDNSIVENSNFGSTVMDAWNSEEKFKN